MTSASIALRPRLTTSVAGGPTQVSAPLPQRARLALSSISGDRPLEELVVLAASVARTIVLAEHTSKVGLAVVGPAGPVAVTAGFDDATTPAQLLVGLDAALREAAADTSPVDVDGAILVRSRRIGDDACAGAGVGAALRVTLDAPDGERRDLMIEAAPGVAEPWFLHVLIRSVAAALAAFTDPRRPFAEAAAGSPEDLTAARTYGRGRSISAVGGVTLSAAVAAAATAHPDRQAVLAGRGSLTYSRLWEKAGSVAARLVALGVEPRGRVGVCVGASVHALPAILGVLRAGAAVVPLDAPASAGWTAAVLADAGVEVLLTDGNLGLNAGPGRVVVDVASDPSDAQAAVLPPETGADDVACVLYAPESTGPSAGALVRHSILARHVPWRMPHDAPGGDVTLLHLPLQAGDSFSELFLVLAAGGRLVLADPADVRPAELAGMVAGYRVSRLAVRVAEYAALLDHLAPVADSLRLVTVTGEAMPADLVARHRTVLPGVRLVTGYCPPGSPMAVAVFDHGADDADACPRRPLGSPAPGAVVRVVTANGRDLPPGFIGALRLAGLDRAGRGNDQPGPATAGSASERSALFDHELDTGDLAWWRPDGVLEFAGRAVNALKGREAAALQENGDPAEHDRVEAVVTEVFRDALGGRPVAADDDFFLLGGHSLLALSVLEAISDRLGVMVDVDDFFAAATVRAVAGHIRAARGKRAPSSAPADHPQARASQDADALARLLDEFERGEGTDEARR